MMNPDTKVLPFVPPSECARRSRRAAEIITAPCRAQGREMMEPLNQACARSICIYSRIRPKRYHLMLICAEAKELRQFFPLRQRHQLHTVFRPPSLTAPNPTDPAATTECSGNFCFRRRTSRSGHVTLETTVGQGFYRLRKTKHDVPARPSWLYWGRP